MHPSIHISNHKHAQLAKDSMAVATEEAASAVAAAAAADAAAIAAAAAAEAEAVAAEGTQTSNTTLAISNEVERVRTAVAAEVERMRNVTAVLADAAAVATEAAALASKNVTDAIVTTQSNLATAAAIAVAADAVRYVCTNTSSHVIVQYPYTYLYGYKRGMCHIGLPPPITHLSLTHAHARICRVRDVTAAAVLASKTLTAATATATAEVTQVRIAKTAIMGEREMCMGRGNYGIAQQVFQKVHGCFHESNTYRMTDGGRSRLMHRFCCAIVVLL